MRWPFHGYHYLLKRLFQKWGWMKCTVIICNGCNIILHIGPLQLSHVHNSYLGAVTLWDWICEFHSYCHLTNVFWLDSWRRISSLFIWHSTSSKNIEWNHLFHLNSSRHRRQGHSSNWLICKSHRQDSTHKDRIQLSAEKKLALRVVFDHNIQDSTFLTWLIYQTTESQLSANAHQRRRRRNQGG